MIRPSLTRAHAPDEFQTVRELRAPLGIAEAETARKTDRACLRYSRSAYIPLRSQEPAIFESLPRSLSARLEQLLGGWCRFRFSGEPLRPCQASARQSTMPWQHPTDKEPGDSHCGRLHRYRLKVCVREWRRAFEYQAA